MRPTLISPASHRRRVQFGRHRTRAKSLAEHGSGRRWGDDRLIAADLRPAGIRRPTPCRTRGNDASLAYLAGFALENARVGTITPSPAGPLSTARAVGGAMTGSEPSS